MFDLLNKVDGYDPNINTVEMETSSDKDWFSLMINTRPDASLDSMLILSPTVFIREYKKLHLDPDAIKDDVMRAIDGDISRIYGAK